MRVDVAFTANSALPSHDVCIVIDALRATSSLATMFARGLTSVLLASSLAQARRHAREHPRWLLCGERRGLPPSGFHFGNSPSEMASMDLRRKRAVFVTTNGTRALMQASFTKHVYAGALLNVSAVVNAAYASAPDKGSILVQCAGDRGGRLFALEDAFTAGAFVQSLLRRNRSCELSDAAEGAVRLYQSFNGSGLQAFRQASHGVGLEEIGLGRDIAFCARADLYASVPRLRMIRGEPVLVDAAGARRS